MKKKKLVERGWMIKDPFGHIRLCYSGKLRYIAWGMMELNTRRTKEEFYKQGYRAVRVEIREI